MAAASARRYRPSRSWPVFGLALAAAAGAVLTTGAISSALDGGPEPAFAPRLERLAGAVPQAHSAIASGAVPPAAPAPPPTGAWQIQVGAFRNAAAAGAHLRSLEGAVPELARLTATLQLRGDLNRVRIGGIEDEAAARRLCARILAAGRGCFVVRPAET